MEKIGEFLFSSDARAVFLLCGYAGTGKTTLIGALVKCLSGFNFPSVLMAPTGRAAKVFSEYSGKPAMTIHKSIYRQKNILESTEFVLTDNRRKNTVFIVDEASMITNGGMVGFGSGSLLGDLIEYVYSGKGCRLLLLGDDAQLPPIGQCDSPALSVDVLKMASLTVEKFELTQVMRQLGESGILYNATILRQMLSSGRTDTMPTIHFKGFPDVCRITGETLIEELESSYASVGRDDTIVLCRSNKRANVYNEGIRRRVLYREEELNRGDLLMIVKNNYYWRDELGKQNKELLEKLSFIANGDVAEVLRVGCVEEMYGFRFAQVTISFPDYEDCEMELKIILNTLYSESPALTLQESEGLFSQVCIDYREVKSKRERIESIRENPYYNALQVKFGYAVTCHKAQGGQWRHVFLDQGFIQPSSISSDYYRWLYTAFTRAKEKIYLVNWPTE